MREGIQTDIPAFRVLRSPIADVTRIYSGTVCRWASQWRYCLRDPIARWQMLGPTGAGILPRGIKTHNSNTECYWYSVCTLWESELPGCKNIVQRLGAVRACPSKILKNFHKTKKFFTSLLSLAQTHTSGGHAKLVSDGLIFISCL